jgi:hypothetical protein
MDLAIWTCLQDCHARRAKLLKELVALAEKGAQAADAKG